MGPHQDLERSYTSPSQATQGGDAVEPKKGTLGCEHNHTNRERQAAEETHHSFSKVTLFYFLHSHYDYTSTLVVVNKKIR